jgi:hypothetical protein
MDSVAHLGVAHFFKVNSHAFKNIITHRHSATYDSMTQLGVPHCHLVSPISTPFLQFQISRHTS